LAVTIPGVLLGSALIASRFRGRLEESRRATANDFRTDVIERERIKIRRLVFLPFHGTEAEAFGVARTLATACEQQERNGDSGEDFLNFHDRTNLFLGRGDWTVLYRERREWG
jgi:hypothetical protein